MPISPSERLVKSSWTDRAASRALPICALSAIRHGLSRYIITYGVHDGSRGCDETLKRALRASDCDDTQVAHRPLLLSDNGASYIATDLAKWLEDRGIRYILGAPFHPQTQTKIERWHQTLNNRILLESRGPRSKPSSITTRSGVTTRPAT